MDVSRMTSSTEASPIWNTPLSIYCTANKTVADDPAGYSSYFKVSSYKRGFKLVNYYCLLVKYYWERLIWTYNLNVVFIIVF